MREPRWIRLEDRLVLHEMLLLQSGGVAGVRDEASLDSVLARPQEQFAAGVSGLPELAACYAAGIALRRPFVSANLGSAFVIATVVLRSNGLLFTGKELPVVETMLELAQGQGSASFYARYLWCNCRAP